MRKYKHMDLDNRITIHLMLNDSKSFKAIGDAIGKDCTSVSREVRNHLQFQTGVTKRASPYQLLPLNKNKCRWQR